MVGTQQFGWVVQRIVSNLLVRVPEPSCASTVSSLGEGGTVKTN